MKYVGVVLFVAMPIMLWYLALDIAFDRNRQLISQGFTQYTRRMVIWMVVACIVISIGCMWCAIDILQGDP